MRHLSSLAAVLAILVACNSESDLGDECDRAGGGPGTCEDGTVCGRPTEKAAQFVCIRICGEGKDCPSGSDCKGVEGTSVKGCRFKD